PEKLYAFNELSPETQKAIDIDVERLEAQGFRDLYINGGLVQYPLPALVVFVPDEEGLVRMILPQTIGSSYAAPMAAGLAGRMLRPSIPKSSVVCESSDSYEIWVQSYDVIEQDDLRSRVITVNKGGIVEFI